MNRESLSAVAFRELAQRAGAVPATALVESSSLGEADAAEACPEGRFVECVCRGESVGGHSLLEHLLRQNQAHGSYAALVDAADALDPGTLAPGLEMALLWARCGNARQALKCLDVLLRDDNFSLVTADLRGAERELRRLPHTMWYRLQRLAHQRTGRFVLFVCEHLTSCADIQLHLAQPLSWAKLDQPREEQQAVLAHELRHQRRQPDQLAQAG